MKTNLLLKTSLLAFLFFTACTPFSRQALQQVNTEASFQQIQQDIDPFRGKTVLWGGVIINTDVRGNGTFIKVLETNLDYETMPVKLDNPNGRFIIYKSGFLDPAVYKQGRKITVIGTITGKEIDPVGSIKYAYPVVEAKDLYLWRRWLPDRIIPCGSHQIIPPCRLLGGGDNSTGLDAPEKPQ